MGPGVAEVPRRSPGDPSQRPAPADPESAREYGRDSGGETWRPRPVGPARPQLVGRAPPAPVAA
eukprot:5057473-Alexandrium_andersonii.AAC.1